MLLDFQTFSMHIKCLWRDKNDSLGALVMLMLPNTHFQAPKQSHKLHWSHPQWQSFHSWPNPGSGSTFFVNWCFVLSAEEFNFIVDFDTCVRCATAHPKAKKKALESNLLSTDVIEMDGWVVLLIFPQNWIIQNHAHWMFLESRHEHHVMKLVLCVLWMMQSAPLNNILESSSFSQSEKVRSVHQRCWSCPCIHVFWRLWDQMRLWIGCRLKVFCSLDFAFPSKHAHSKFWFWKRHRCACCILPQCVSISDAWESHVIKHHGKEMLKCEKLGRCFFSLPKRSTPLHFFS